MKIFNIFFLALCTTTFAFSSCDSKEEMSSDEETLPKIKSFKYAELATNDYPSLVGFNQFTYDSKGRVVGYNGEDRKEVVKYADNGKWESKGTDNNGKVIETMSGTTTKDWLPETLSGLNSDGTKLEMDYSYDSSNRTIGNNITIGDGRIKFTTLEYDSATGLIKDAKVRYRQGAGQPENICTFTFIYSDQDNPVAFYPENFMLIDSMGTFSIPGLDGYSRNKLVDKIELRIDGVLNGSYDFKYDFSSDGHLSAIHWNITEYDEDMKPTRSMPLYDFTEITY